MARTAIHTQDDARAGARIAAGSPPAGPATPPHVHDAPSDGPVRPDPALRQHLPPLHRGRRSLRAEIALTRAALAATVVLALLLVASMAGWVAGSPAPVTVRVVVEQVVFVAVGAALLYGALVHLVARLGYLHRARAFVPPTPEQLHAVHDGRPPRLAVLVPSYREDPRLVRLTLLSAALQDHPRHRVVLLVDDPPNPRDHEHRRTLEATRRLPGELQQALDEPARRFATTREDFERRARAHLDLAFETRRAAALWDEAAAWFEAQAATFRVRDHVEAFFRREILERPATMHRATAAELRWRAATVPLDVTGLAREHRRLAALFAVDLASFERKRCTNLSHAPNKAMNLNSYVQLLGNTYRVEPGPDGALLHHDEVHGTFHVPEADHLITLDADSLLLPGYALHLARVLQQPGNERVGLVQTPYSAFPGAPTAVERVAGATTDIMCLVHQGTSRHDAAYWVGANAMVRTAALRDVAQHDTERGHPITRFVQDRTLTEDTESTIDLVDQGWTVANYPARLAYSATPPDFGSLLIQRRRWANGGLLILPRLLEHVRRTRPGIRQAIGLLLRLNYLTSLAAANVAFLVLMTYPFASVHAPPWLPLLAVPYFGLYARDLVQLGYRRTDIVRVYALTLLLIPVHLGGVLKSLQQAVTGRPTPFRRTPKVPARTPVPALYVVATVGLVVLWGLGAVGDLAHDRNERAVFTALNAGLLAYAVTRFMGWRAAIGDLWLGLTGHVAGWARRPVGLHARRPRTLLGRLAVVPVLLLVAITGLAMLRLENAELGGLADGSSRMNVLVVGTDSREGLSSTERDRLSLGDFEGERADTMFLLSIQGGRAATLAIPRDLYTERCDGSRGRINEAIQIAGPACLVDTVEAVSDVPVSHYLQMDFRGLVDVVDAIGGVTMTVDQRIVDDKTGADLHPGTQRLSGTEALAFVRVRSIDSDLGRIDRQQAFVQALVRELGSPSTLANPLTLARAVGAGAGALTVDRGVGPVDLARLGLGVHGAVDGGDMPTFTLPSEPRRIDGEKVLVPDDTKAGPLTRAFATGQVLEAQPRR